MSGAIKLVLAASIAFAIALTDAGHFGQSRDLFSIAKNSGKAREVAKTAAAQDLDLTQSNHEVQQQPPHDKAAHANKDTEAFVANDYYYYNDYNYYYKSPYYYAYNYASNYTFEEGWGILQYYSGSMCNGTLTQNYGYRNGACISTGSSESFRVVFNSSSGLCSDTMLRHYNDGNCQHLQSIIPIGEQTTCTQEENAMYSDFSSVNFLCIYQSEVPVLMNSLMFSYRGDVNYSSSSVVCSAQIDAFESAATGMCLSNPDFHYSYQAHCSTDGSSYTLKKYAHNESCPMQPDDDDFMKVHQATTCSETTPFYYYSPMSSSSSMSSSMSSSASSSSMSSSSTSMSMSSSSSSNNASYYSSYGGMLPNVRTHRPSYYPTAMPTFPSHIPVCNASSTYSASHTHNAQRNTIDCSLTVCSDTKIAITICGNNGTCPFGSLYNANSGQFLSGSYGPCNTSLCTEFVYYTRNNSCQSYVLQQGCYGSDSCTGEVNITKTFDDTSLNYGYYYYYNGSYSASPSSSFSSSSSYYGSYNSYYAEVHNVYTVSQCVGQNYTLSGFQPSVRPSEAPLLSPRPTTHEPSKTPTMKPTAVPAAVSVAVVQTITGISYSTYKSKSNYTKTLKASIAGCMTGVTSSDIVNLVVTSYTASSSSSSSYPFSVPYLRKKQVEGTAIAATTTTTNSISASYNVYVASPTTGMTYDTLVSQLSTAVSGTTFTTLLTTYSAVYSTSGFTNVTSSTIQSTSNTNSVSSTSSSSNTLSNGAIAGIIIACIIIFACCVGVIGYFACRKTSLQSGALGYQVEMANNRGY